MLGCVTRGPNLCLVVEFMPYGDLLHFLRGRRSKVSSLNRFCILPCVYSVVYSRFQVKPCLEFNVNRHARTKELISVKKASKNAVHAVYSIPLFDQSFDNFPILC